MALAALGALAGPAHGQSCSDLYDPNQVLNLYVTMDPADWEALRASCPGGICGPQPYTYYTASLRCEQDAPIQVGIRRKNGKAEPSESDPQKPALKIDIDEFVPEQTFHGKAKLSLENGGEDSLVSEGLSWLLHQTAGVVASRAAWVKVHVNGDYKGLYIDVEQIDKTFLGDHGIDDGGWLFKVEQQRTREGQPNPFAFNWYPFDHPHTPPEQPTPPDWQSQASWRVNMPHLLTLAALENFIANTDGLIGQMHNYWYYDWSVFPEGQQPRLYLVWDLDTSMRNNATTYPILGQGAGHLREGVIVGDPGFQAQYLEIYHDLLLGPLALSQTHSLANAMEAVISTAMDSDPFQTTGSAAGEFQRVRNFFSSRTAFLLGELGDCPDGTCGPGENPCTCPPDCGAAPSTEAACANGADDDCDGFTDCQDGNCAPEPACAAAPPVSVLRINEVVANTPGSPDVEFVELYNAGPDSQDLTGWYLLDDDNLHDKCFLEGSLAPGGYLVVAGDLALFGARWEVPNVNSNAFNGSAPDEGYGLSNQGDAVRLFRPTAQSDAVAHGFTFGLQGADIPFGYLPRDADAPEYLQSPTPGGSNETAAFHSPICINEFLTTSQSGGVDDWVELYNRGAATVDIGGWFLTDELAQPTRYAFPPGTLIPPGGHLSVDETVLGFGLTSTGSDVIMLTHADGSTGQDYFDYGPQFPDVTQGRFPDGRPHWHFLEVPSRGQPNACLAPPLPPVIGFRFTSPAAFSWSELAGAEAYDIVKGDLGILRLTSGSFSAAVTGCHEDNVERTSWWDAEEVSAGAALFYLVRAVDHSCGFGTYDESPSSSQVASRDPGIAVTSSACP